MWKKFKIFAEDRRYSLHILFERIKLEFSYYGFLKLARKLVAVNYLLFEKNQKFCSKNLSILIYDVRQISSKTLMILSLYKN